MQSIPQHRRECSLPFDISHHADGEFTRNVCLLIEERQTRGHLTPCIVGVREKGRVLAMHGARHQWVRRKSPCPGDMAAYWWASSPWLWLGNGGFWPL